MDTGPSTALVTGATAGIGRAAALELAASGTDLIVHGRDTARGAALVAELETTGIRAEFVAADLAVPDDVLRLADTAKDVDVLVNSAGVYEFTSTADTDADGFDRHMAVNTRAPFLLVGVIAPRMAARGAGVIVNVSSSAATMPAPVGAAYGASKAAIELLTRSWSTEYGAAGVRVNAVSPGPVRSDGTALMLGDAITMLDRGTLRGRAADPAEIARVIGFLAGPGSSYMNGSVVLADGGVPSALPA